MLQTEGKQKWDYPALLNFRKTYLTNNKRSGIAKKVDQEIKSQNPLKPAITKKSVTLASNASNGEFRRKRKLSQKAHCEILH